MTAPSGKSHERLVAAIQHAATQGATVTWNDHIGGRQFDVTIRFKHGIHSYLTVVECKEFSSKVSVEKVDAFVTKARDAKADKAVMVSTSGFQSGCLEVANRHGIQLLVLTESTELSPDHLLAKIIPGIKVYNVSFVQIKGYAPVEFEDWGGRLAYLMKHSRLVHQSGSKTVDQRIYEWQLTWPLLEPGREIDVELPLPPATKLVVPGEKAVPVTQMRFTYSLVNLQVMKDTGLDAHILEGMSTKVELRDPDGNLHHTTRLNAVPLGFDATVTVGKFYEIPTMFSRYVCDKIEGDLVTWTMVESYQHGEMLQVTFTQDLKYAGHFVEITDEKINRRLQVLLGALGSHPKH